MTRVLPFLSALLVLSLSFAVPSAVFSAEAPGPALTVEGMAGAFLKYFPRAEGKVTYSGGGTIRLDIGARDGLQPGMEVFLFRPGRAIRHPVTKVILGYTEEPLGKAVVTSAGDKVCEAKVTELLVTRIIPGDTGRLSTDKARLVVAAYGKDYNERALSRMLGVLGQSGRFEMEGTVEIPAGRAVDAASAGKLISDKRADDLITLSTAPTVRRDRTKVDMALYKADGTKLMEQSGLVDMTSEVYSETVLNYPLVMGEHRDFYRMEDLPYRARHMCAGRITGGKTTEVALSDGHGIIIYRLDASGMHELWREASDVSETNLDLECADLNGNGRDEIYVTNMTGGRLSSYVVEYDGKGFKRIADGLPLFFRVLNVPGKGPRLITSTLGSISPYSGVIRRYRWSGGKLKRGDELRLPRKISDPYGFALADMVPGRKGPEIVWVDDSDYVQVLDMKGHRLWKSPERYGGYDNFFERAGDGHSVSVPGAGDRGKVKGRVIVTKGPDGAPVVVVTRNIPLTYITDRFKGYSGAEIYGLAWSGEALEERWSIKGIAGYLADIYLGDAVNDGRHGILILTDPTYKAVKSSRKIGIGGVNSVFSYFANRANLLVYKTPQR